MTDVTEVSTNESYNFNYTSISNCFSNYYMCTFNEGTRTFSSVIQYLTFHKYMAYNNNDEFTIKIITEIISNTRDLSKISHNIPNFTEDSWNVIKKDIIRDAILCKFTTNKTMSDQLLATGNKNIYCLSNNESFYSIGFVKNDNGTITYTTGENYLGKTLMYVRDILMKEKSINNTELKTEPVENSNTNTDTNSNSNTNTDTNSNSNSNSNINTDVNSESEPHSNDENNKAPASVTEPDLLTYITTAMSNGSWNKDVFIDLCHKYVSK
jgi:ribA/ribD-fused uncharacterized protein